MSRNTNPVIPVQSTAGAIPVRNEKGQVSMQKVKVNRYISGKRPDYAHRESSEESSEDDDFIVPNRMKKLEEEDILEDIKVDLSEAEKYDPRLRRLLRTGRNRQRQIEEPEVLEDSGSDEARPGRQVESDSESEAEEEDDREIERKRIILRQRALEKLEEDEVLAKEEEKDSEESEEESESEYEEYTDSEEEVAPRLKPVFVRKSQRVTIKPELIEEVVKTNTSDKKREEKRVETLKMIESEIRRDKTGKEDEESMATLPQLTDVNTDDENEDAEYEAWKLRELKRTKRDRDEREAIEREKLEIQRLHSLTEEERRAELKLRPKVVINKASKGKYKFLQKYYHRGAFYLDKEEDVLRRDNSLPTLEDHFDKSILPKVMQVKNFGRSGRTKYTHLVDQDTTTHESPWTVDSTQNLKFYATQAAGTRQVFDRPSGRRRHLDPPQN